MDKKTMQLLKENGIKPTKALKEAVKKYNLTLVHIGTLSYKGNRHVKSKPAMRDEVNPTKGIDYVLEFNHAERNYGWTAWETPLLTYEEALKIWENEKDRPLWNSRHFFLFDGDSIFSLL